MLQRNDFYNLQKDLRKYDIDILDIVRESGKAIDFLNCSEISEDFILISDWLVKAEDLIKGVFNRLLAEINPYNNQLIAFDNEKKQTYKNFKLEMSNFMDRVDDKRKEIVDKISIKDMDDPSTILSTKMKFNSHLLFLKAFLREFVLKVLQNAYKRFSSFENLPGIKIVEKEDGKDKENVYMIESVVNDIKDKRIFWYCVYFYVAEMSSVNVALFKIKDPVHIKPSEMTDVWRHTGASVGNFGSSIPISKSPNNTKEGGENKTDDEGDDGDEEQEENTEELEGDEE